MKANTQIITPRPSTAPRSVTLRLTEEQAAQLSAQLKDFLDGYLSDGSQETARQAVDRWQLERAEFNQGDDAAHNEELRALLDCDAAVLHQIVAQLDVVGGAR